MHDQKMRCGRGGIRIGLTEVELQLERGELRVHGAHDLRGGAIAALPLA
jgi:hypothetical protein